MKKYLGFMVFMLVTVMFLVGCGNNGGTGADGDVNFDFDFSESDEGWTGDFTDYPVNFEPDVYELEFAHKELPAELERAGKGLMLQGHNRSDDLFMYMKKQLTGLKPDTRYAIVLETEFATDAPAGAVGIGGPPGEALFVKVGASTIEPVPVEGEAGGEPNYQLNVDKGSQSEGGENAIVVGDAAKLVNDEFEVYEMKTLSNSGQPLEIQTDADGNLWVFVGTDSGFEGRTTLYYTGVKVTLTEK
jgi:hypothetical protein